MHLPTGGALCCLHNGIAPGHQLCEGHNRAQDDQTRWLWRCGRDAGCVCYIHSAAAAVHNAAALRADFCIAWCSCLIVQLHTPSWTHGAPHGAVGAACRPLVVPAHVCMHVQHMLTGGSHRTREHSICVSAAPKAVPGIEEARAWCKGACQRFCSLSKLVDGVCPAAFVDQHESCKYRSQLRRYIRLAHITAGLVRYKPLGLPVVTGHLTPERS
jgi:hypothetical protein